MPDHEQAGGQYRGQMYGDANAVDAVAEPVPFARRAAVGIAVAGVTGDVQVGEAREGEAEESPCKNEDWECQDCGKISCCGDQHSGKL